MLKIFRLNRCHSQLSGSIYIYSRLRCPPFSLRQKSGGTPNYSVQSTLVLLLQKSNQCFKALSSIFQNVTSKFTSSLPIARTSFQCFVSIGKKWQSDNIYINKFLSHIFTYCSRHRDIFVDEPFPNCIMHSLMENTKISGHAFFRFRQHLQNICLFICALCLVHDLGSRMLTHFSRV